MSGGAAPARVGLAGFGFIGRYVLERMQAHPGDGLIPAFVWNRRAEKLDEVPVDLRLDDLSRAADRAPDLIVEVSHPDVTRGHGAAFLAAADYMPLSVSCLVDAPLEADLLAAAEKSGRRLLVPHGALVGVDNLVEGRENWAEVTITFEKHPNAIDFSESGLAPETEARTVVFDGSAREIGRLFPRNVNTMVTCALATVGLDACRAVLISDPALEVGIADVLAIGQDGARLHSRKEQPMSGVSGTEMLGALYGSILRAAGRRTGLQFV